MMSELRSPFRLFYVDASKRGRVAEKSLEDLPSGDVLIQASFSSLNYKDALAATGHPGVARQLPHVPGIDVVGTVAESVDARFAVGDRVFVTGHELGAPCWGGWSQYVRVPADWIMHLPDAINEVGVMALGTAGFTAAQGVLSLQRHAITPERGEVLVTGATGGVGSIAVRLLARLGYTVMAVTGKADQHRLLKDWGATEILSRDVFDGPTGKPLWKGRWAGAIDTVGGQPLANVIKQVIHRGCVATCGSVAGTDLPLTVYPFILRGVTLDGIDSAQCPAAERAFVWEKLFGPWWLSALESQSRIVPLTKIAGEVEAMLRGKITGRVIVDLEA